MEKQLALVDPKEYGLEEKTAVEMINAMRIINLQLQKKEKKSK